MTDPSLGLAALLDVDHPVKREVAEWATEHLAQPDAVERDRESRFFAEGWQRCADRGIVGMHVPGEFGGQGADLITTVLTLEGLGYGCRDNGLAFAIGSQMLSHQVALVWFGSDEQKQRWLPRLCRGEAIGAFAITELDVGSDPSTMSARAVRRGDGSYVLNGHKAYITLGPVADVAIVFASTNPGAGGWGISAFVVPTDAPGFERAPNREKSGMRTTPFGDLALTDVEVPADALLGREGAGMSIFAATMQMERGYVFATQIGAMQRQMDDCVRYAKERQQGGRSIGDYQAVSHRIADMKLRHETARLLMYKTALLAEAGRPTNLATSLTKLGASEAAVASAIDAADIHGARGYVSEYGVERDLRDALGGLVYSGTSNIQRNIIARLLGVG